MTHFGIICLEATGHLNTVFPIGREMQRRGHIVTIFSTLGAKTKAIELGFNFRAIGEKEYLAKGYNGKTHKKQLSPNSSFTRYFYKNGTESRNRIA